MQGTVVGTFGAADAGGSFDARNDGLTVAVNCQGVGSVTVIIVGKSAYSLPCAEDQPTSYENRDYTAHGTGQVQVTTAGQVVWALTIARLPLAGAPTG
ncbi:hypothetical protein CVV68_11915 [Arthrobacter livingstonensis]|uniref:Uncharacterized protein n=2 Tax=Arthrobacter livingstonensis TaxID=670078 RepID=A0A2V5L9J5_9MICC|nr:hypothetical protein CVV68_11915 [Arthrobacter livingstonensis]